MSTGLLTGQAGPEVAREDVEAQLERILASKPFAGAASSSRFLRFIVTRKLAGEADLIKESLIGVEVFHRQPGYDAGSDPVVRVRARQVRARLGEYYLGEGGREPVRIEIPKGGYVPVFRKVQPEAPAPQPHRRSLWCLLVLALVGAAILYSARLLRSPAGQPSIAVLPFLNLTGNPADDAMVDGLTEELTTTFAQSREMRVVARSSAFQFRGGNDVRAIGRQLGARYVMEGSVRRETGRLIVTAQLIDTGNGYHLFADRFERPPDQAFSIPGAIARRAQAALVMNGRTEAAVAEPVLPAPQAHALYLEGRYLQHQPGNGNRKRAMELFRRAVEIDPVYSTALGALAVAHAVYTFHQSETPAEDARLARENAQRALAAEERTPEAHLALAMVAYWHEWNWAEAEPRYRRAIEIAPSYATAHNNYALALMTRGRSGEAIAEAGKALDLDPLSFAVSNDLAVALYVARRFAESRERADRVLAIKPAFYLAHLIKGSDFYCERRYAEAIAECRIVLEAAGNADGVLGRLGAAYAMAGRREDADAIRRRLEAIPDRDRNWIYRAMFEVGAGEFEHALESLGRAVKQRETDVLFLDADPVWDPIRSDARFQVLRGLAGLK